MDIDGGADHFDDTGDAEMLSDSYSIAVAEVGGDDMSRAMMTVVMKCMLRIWSWRR